MQVFESDVSCIKFTLLKYRVLQALHFPRVISGIRKQNKHLVQRNKSRTLSFISFQPEAEGRVCILLPMPRFMQMPPSSLRDAKQSTAAKEMQRTVDADAMPMKFRSHSITRPRLQQTFAQAIQAFCSHVHTLRHLPDPKPITPTPPQ